jgi:hypothetical protein
MATIIPTTTIPRMRAMKAVPAKSRTGVFSRSKLMAIGMQGNVHWVAYAQWTNDSGSPIASFQATWVVPQRPQAPDEGQLFYLFVGLGTPSFILQPILKWDIDGGGNPGWFVAGMISTGQNGNQTINGLTAVASGDPVTGVITLESGGPGAYVYSCRIDTAATTGSGPNPTTTQTAPLAELTEAYVALESYFVKDGSYYPAGVTTLSNIQVQTQSGLANPAWQPGGSSSNGEHISIGPGGQPDIVIIY